MPRDAASMLLDNFAGVPLHLQAELLDPSLAAAGRPYVASLAYFDAGDGSSGLLNRLLYTDIKTYLVELLMKQDQMSMSTSIESRVPFLDHKLVELAAGLPDRFKLSRFTTKWILREAVRGLLPASVLTRRKMGFPVPFSTWIRGPWHAKRGVINHVAVRRLLDDTRTGTRAGADAVWALLNLELWHRTFIDGDGIQTLTGPVKPAAAYGTAAVTRPDHVVGAGFSRPDQGVA
jgi:asparagine synthase (glutamine-hydrolysing)